MFLASESSGDSRPGRGCFRRVGLAVGLLALFLLAVVAAGPGCRLSAGPPVDGQTGDGGTGNPPVGGQAGDGGTAGDVDGAFWAVTGPQPASAPGLSLGRDVLPFAVLHCSSETASLTIPLGAWDLARGTVAFEEEPLCTVAASEVRLAWNGGATVGVLTPEGTRPTDLHPGLRFVTFRPKSGYLDFAGAVVCPESSGITYAAVVRSPDDTFALEVRTDPAAGQAAGETQAYPLEPPETGLTLFRAVDVAVVGGKVEAVLEAARTDSTVHLYRIVLDGGEVVWGEPTDELGVVEAGAGTRMARYGDWVYVGEQDDAISRVDLTTGKVTKDDVLSGLVASFNEVYGRNIECLTPPDFFACGPVLVVEYQPADYRNPSAYLLAVRDGRVVGEVVWACGRLTVKKDGQVTMEADLPAELAPYWVFPQG